MRKLSLLLLMLTSSLCLGAESLQKLSVVLDWFPNPDHAPLIVAEQQGYFKEEGLDVKLIAPADPSDAPKLVAARQADLGITYEPQFMEQVDRGLPLITIGTLIDKPLSSLVALNGSGIKSVNDLKGKRIGASMGGLSSIMLKTMLAKEGLTEKDIQIVNVKYNLMQALLSHKVDAVTGVMRNYEVPHIELHDNKATTFFPEEQGIPTYSELVFITHIQNDHDERLSRFLHAIKKAVAYLDHHPTQTWQQFIAKYPEANNKMNHQAWFATIPYFAEDPADINHQEWEKFASFMYKNQMIKKNSAGYTLYRSTASCCVSWSRQHDGDVWITRSLLRHCEKRPAQRSDGIVK